MNCWNIYRLSTIIIIGKSRLSNMFKPRPLNVDHWYRWDWFSIRHRQGKTSMINQLWCIIGILDSQWQSMIIQSDIILFEFFGDNSMYWIIMFSIFQRSNDYPIIWDINYVTNCYHIDFQWLRMIRLHEWQLWSTAINDSSMNLQ